MAFSTNQLNYINSLMSTLISDNPDVFYVAYTDTSTNTGEADLYIAVSDSEIRTSDGYSYTITSGSYTLYSVITGNYSSYQGNNNKRVSVSTRSASTLNVDVYEHISTNAVFLNEIFLQPDYINSIGGYTNVQNQTSLTSLNVISAVLLLFTFFTAFFKRFI